MKRLLLALILIATSVAAAEKPLKPVPPPDLAAPPADAERVGEGLVTKQLSPPTGTDRPSEADLVRIRYVIWSSDGRLVNFIAPPQSTVVPVGTLLRGLRNALLLMSAGEKRRIWIPESLGAAGKVPPGGTLVVDAELLGIVHPPVTPKDVGSPPDDAIRTKSGLAYKVLHKGDGTRHPKASSTVLVNYSGWTVSGFLFDSSILRGDPVELGLNDVIAGWREGLQLMTEGESTRFWIPVQLAYNNEMGKPRGMLVFDVDLLKIVK